LSRPKPTRVAEPIEEEEPFSENPAFYEIMWKFAVKLNRPQMII